ncbi:Gfo/Idh/MocA family protein [Streptomonospora nanhaiensis]|uniref:Gfo/Idh/MocA family protein n=1 Tax=Streptomonospora nanhaiensis TaxID=1323731 RepID=UPI001C38765A|nr:Gfo/Idh/MocA family oxidoreductase [Streptomonospora nanhaiensis]MBV2363351.1 Gfo/Idh/MocA family oxidoreductase [Streptomonospora nanhaiensis]
MHTPDPAPGPADPLRVAVVGTGNIARYHVEALQALSGDAVVVAAADVNPDALAVFTDRYGIPERFTDLDRMLGEVRPDLVHLCTPPGLHHGQALACLRAGVNALVEKPPALSLAELEDMAAAEGPQGPYVATLFQHRFGSGARRVRALVESGGLGRPLLAVCHTLWFRDQAYFDVPWRGRWDTEGGGPTMGHGIHQMDLLLALLGDWTEVSATARRQARVMETEDLSLAHVAFANGAVASVVNSVLSPREESYIRLDFERATVELRHLYGYGDSDWTLTPAPGFEEAAAAAWAAGESGVASGHHAQIAQVLAALRAKEPPPVTTADALRTLRLVAGLYASAAQRRTVTPAELRRGSRYYDRMHGGGTPWQSR